VNDAHAEAARALVDVMDQVGERLCPLPSLRLACATIRSGVQEARPPYAGLATAAGLEATALPRDDQELWLAMASAVARGQADRLEVADWLAIHAALTLFGQGTPADPRTLALCAAHGTDGDADLDALEAALTPVVERWQALEAVDATERLSALGWWGLPEAQRRAWYDR